MFGPIRCVALLAAFLSALGCSDGILPDAVAGVAVAPVELTIAPGTTVPYSATVTSASGRVLTDRSVTWSSSDPSVASVNPNTGLVTTLSSGTTTISATSEGRSGSALLRIAFPVQSVVLSPDSAALVVGGTLRFTATLRDASGNVLPGRTLVWSSTNASVVRVDSAGLATGISPGVASVIAVSEGRADTALVRVTGPVASIAIVPDSADLLVGGSLQLVAVLRDAQGTVLTGRSVTWSTSHSGIAQVEAATGRVAGVSTGVATISATSEGRTATARVRVSAALRDQTISGGLYRTCGISVAGDAYCAGGSMTDYLPSLVEGGHKFRSIASGANHRCALTVDGVAYCWGGGLRGQLGEGGVGGTDTPQLVSGGHTFVVLSTLVDHTCGVASNGGAYCWGDNPNGQLGIGSVGGVQRVPALVAGGLTFSDIAAGSTYSCALTLAGAAYCWGSNAYGQLGDGTNVDRSVPTAVAGGHRFRRIFAGRFTTCAIDLSDVAYCWGNGANGELGDGSPVSPGSGSVRNVPAAVVGSTRYQTLNVGGTTVCGLALTGEAFCWGGAMALGTGSQTNSSVPVAVEGGRRYRTITCGGFDHCAALTLDDAAFAWGENSSGKLGDGTNTNRPTPVRVFNGIVFR